MSKTPAMRHLDKLDIAYESREYDHRVKGAEFAAEALGWPVKAMIKTLVVRLSNGDFVFCLMPGDKVLSLKKLARAAGVKEARMAKPVEAERQTGYLTGGISPFGARKALPVWLDESILESERIGINGGKRGNILFLDPALIEGAPADISS